VRESRGGAGKLEQISWGSDRSASKQALEAGQQAQRPDHRWPNSRKASLGDAWVGAPPWLPFIQQPTCLVSSGVDASPAKHFAS
jgi:hypothetical protein